MEIKNTKSVKPDRLNTLIYAASGAGKTTLLGTLKGKTLIISKESGLLPLKDLDIDYIEPKSLGELRSILVSDLIKPYDNIAIDSLSEIASMIVEEAKRAYPADNQTLKVWGQVAESVAKFIRFTRDLDKNIIFTCLEKTSEDNIGRRFNLPDIPGSMAKKISSFFDFVFNLQVMQKDDVFTRVLLTDSRDGTIAKDRSGKLETYEPAHLGAIINKIFDE